MNRYVTLLRGINVGGHHKLPMAELRALLKKIGCDDVATYIQSGNAVFRHAAQAGEIAASMRSAIAGQFHFDVPVLVLRATEFQTIAAANPFAKKKVSGNRIHVTFPAGRIAADAEERLRQRLAENERFELTGKALYLFAPDGIARSKIAADTERCLGTSATSRNWRTVLKLIDLLQALP